jgi:4-hydroxybenzoate polyprenyltransferase
LTIRVREAQGTTGEGSRENGVSSSGVSPVDSLIAKTPDMREASHLGSLPALRTGEWRRAGRALRASDWWYFSVLPLVSLVGDPRGEADVVLRLLGGILVAALCLAYSYGFNGITDRAMDRDAAKNALAGLAAVPREAALLVAACALAAVGIAATLTPVALLGAGMSLVAATLYSAQPRLKRLPLVGTLVNVLIFAPLPLLAAVGPPSPGMLFLTYCFYVLLTQNQILHELADSDEDVTAGVRTTGVVVGATGVRAIAVVLGPLAALLLWRMQATGSVALLTAALGLCGGATMVALADVRRARQLRVAHRWYSLVVGGVLFALVVRGGA